MVKMIFLELFKIFMYLIIWEFKIGFEVVFVKIVLIVFIFVFDFLSIGEISFVLFMLFNNNIEKFFILINLLMKMR